MPSSLFLLPHQDDEYFAAPVIARELTEGRQIHCIFLTNGATALASADTRNEESRQALERMGVPAKNLEFLGTAQDVADGQLVQRLESIHQFISPKIASLGVDRIYCPAWEGGHQDHDAACALGTVLARVHRVSGWEYSLYQGQSTRGKFFTVMTPVTTRAGAISEHWSARTGLQMALACRSYRSQWRSWVGLLGPALLAFVVQRELWLNPVELESLKQRPHEGALLYERYGRTTYAQVASHVAAYLGQH